MEISEIFKAIEAGRKVQDFLWMDTPFHLDAESSIDDWCGVFQKRIVKISQIEKSNPMWQVELKKRLLQQAALSVALLEKL